MGFFLIMYSAYIYDYYDYPIIKNFDTLEEFDLWYQENKDSLISHPVVHYENDDGEPMIMQKKHFIDEWDHFHTIDGVAVSDEDYFGYDESYDELDESLFNDKLGFNESDEDYELDLDDEIHF